MSMTQKMFRHGLILMTIIYLKPVKLLVVCSVILVRAPTQLLYPQVLHLAVTACAYLCNWTVIVVYLQWTHALVMITVMQETILQTLLAVLPLWQAVYPEALLFAQVQELP